MHRELRSIRLKGTESQVVDLYTVDANFQIVISYPIHYFRLRH